MSFRYLAGRDHDEALLVNGLLGQCGIVSTWRDLALWGQKDETFSRNSAERQDCSGRNWRDTEFDVFDRVRPIQGIAGIHRETTKIVMGPS
jgi:hypothetical protein